MVKRAGPLFLLSLVGCSGSGAQPAEAPAKTAPGSSADNERRLEPDQGLADDPTVVIAAARLRQDWPTEHFSRGEFEAVIGYCRALGDDASNDDRAWCVGLVPASLYALGRDGEGLSVISDVCRRMPPASPQNEARASLIALVMGALAEAHGNGHLKRDEAELESLLSNFLQACQVSEAELKSVVDRMRQGR
jgi:hypothetical protein